MRRIGGAIVAAAALAGATAGPAAAATAPACHAELVGAHPGTTSTCSFDSPTDFATINVAVVDGSLTVTLRCNSQYGYNHVQSHTFNKTGTWTAFTPGGCQMVLTSNVYPTTASASSTPAMRVFDPGPAIF